MIRYSLSLVVQFLVPFALCMHACVYTVCSPEFTFTQCNAFQEFRDGRQLCRTLLSYKKNCVLCDVFKVGENWNTPAEIYTFLVVSHISIFQIFYLGQCLRLTSKTLTLEKFGHGASSATE